LRSWYGTCVAISGTRVLREDGGVRHDRGKHKGWYKTKKVKVKVKGPKHH